MDTLDPESPWRHRVPRVPNSDQRQSVWTREAPAASEPPAPGAIIEFPRPAEIRPPACIPVEDLPLW